MDRVRSALIAGALVLLAARPALAQQCHPWSPGTWRSPGVALGVRLDAAGYRNPRYEGDFEGLAPLVSFSHRRFSALALLPAYRLVRNGRPEFGLGDLALAIRAPIPTWTHGATALGFGLAMTLPTGSVSAGLGMGHVMLMPEFWWAHERGRVQLFGTVGFGRAITSGGAGHHATGPAPIVNPMNRAEVEGSLGASLRVHRLLWLRGGAFGAIPVGTINPAGVSRVVLSQGVVLVIRGLEISAELQAPLTGAPFLARGCPSGQLPLRPQATPRHPPGSGGSGLSS